MRDCGGSERLRDKHAETPRERGRDAPRQTPRQRQAGGGDIFRETQAERGAGGAAPRDLADSTGMRLARSTPARTQLHTAALPPPARRRFPPAEPRCQLPGGSRARLLVTRARACRAGVTGAPGGPPSRTRSPARSPKSHTCPDIVTPGQPSPEWRPRPEQGVRPGAHRTGRGPGLAPPELPWSLGGRTLSPGRCGWPRHPVHSPSRSFRSWLGERGREDAEAGQSARWGAGCGGRASLWDPDALLRRLPPSEPQEERAQTKQPLTPVRGRRKFPGWPGRVVMTPSGGDGTTPGVRTEGPQKMLLGVRGGGTWGRGHEQREGAVELSGSGHLRRPLRPPPILPPSPRAPAPRPEAPSAQSSPPNFDLGGRVVPPPCLRRSPAPLCKSASQRLATAVASRRRGRGLGGLD